MQRTKGWNVLFLCAFAFAGASPAIAKPRQAQALPNFQLVENEVFRGGRPDAEGLRFLKALGVKTILNLENKKGPVREEGRGAAALGIREISVPMSGFWQPKDSTVNEALEILGDRSLRPLYIHCQHGMDRTGLVVGLYRVEQEGWKPKNAYQEMLNYRFHRILFFLDHYFRKRVGL